MSQHQASIGSYILFFGCDTQHAAIALAIIAVSEFDKFVSYYF